jgi:hypothetical protein
MTGLPTGKEPNPECGPGIHFVGTDQLGELSIEGRRHNVRAFVSFHTANNGVVTTRFPAKIK